MTQEAFKLKRQYNYHSKFMTLKEGLKLVGQPVEIPNCSRDGLPEFFAEQGYKVGAEIGVYQGVFTEQFCKAGLKIYGIDPWISFKGQGRSQRVQDNQESNYNYTRKLLSPYGSDRCELIRKTSMEAVRDFRDGSLDFVYIDGDHSFRYVAEDIYEWTKKVRSGGIVSGHDYWHSGPESRNLVCHVDAVVDAYTKLFDIKNWYIFGNIGRGSNNSVSSWMFIKQ